MDSLCSFLVNGGVFIFVQRVVVGRFAEIGNENEINEAFRVSIVLRARDGFRCF